MALTSTIYNFDIDLADSDRGCYESLALRIAQHPSESDEYLVTRLLAYCLELSDGIVFSAGISTPDEPTLAIRDLTGTITTWIEIGLPDQARLHKASKASPRVVVYTHKDPAQWFRQLDASAVYRASHIRLRELDRALVAALAARLERRMALTITCADGHLLIACGETTMEGAIVDRPLLS